MCSILFYVTIAIFIRAKRKIEKEKCLDRNFKLSYAMCSRQCRFRAFFENIKPFWSHEIPLD